MTCRFSATHSALLGIILGVSGYIALSAVSASAKLDNLVMVVPVGSALVLLATAVIVDALKRPAPEPDADSAPIWGDLQLLAGFSVLCYALTHIGFDVATFLFVWVGVVVSGGKGYWQPPLFAALFTTLLVEAFGSLFPYPMPTLVL